MGLFILTVLGFIVLLSLSKFESVFGVNTKVIEIVFLKLIFIVLVSYLFCGLISFLPHEATKEELTFETELSDLSARYNIEYSEELTFSRFDSFSENNITCLEIETCNKQMIHDVYSAFKTYNPSLNITFNNPYNYKNVPTSGLWSDTKDINDSEINDICYKQNDGFIIDYEVKSAEGSVSFGSGSFEGRKLMFFVCDGVKTIEVQTTDLQVSLYQSGELTKLKHY